MRGLVLVASILAVASPISVRASVLSGSEPDPKDVDLVLWLKANALEVRDGAPVERWRDSSARGRDMLGGQRGAGLPRFAADVLNGLPAVRFDGSRQTMELAAPLALAQQHTVIVVGHARSAGEKHSDTFVSFCAAAAPDAPRNGDGGLSVYHADGQRRFGMRYRAAIDTRSSAASNALARPTILAQVRTSDRNARAYLEDASSPWLNISTEPSPAVDTPKYLRLAALDEPKSNLDGDIFEVLVYNRALSPVELRDVYDYLQRKWLPSVPRQARVFYEASRPAAVSGEHASAALYRDRGRSGFDLLDGAIDLFVRSKLASSAWRADSFVPLELDGGPRGLTLALRSRGRGRLELQLQAKDDAGQILNTIRAEASGLALAAGELYHLGLSVSTAAQSGEITLKLYAAPGNTSIDTGSHNFELASASGPALTGPTDHAFGPIDLRAAAQVTRSRLRVWQGVPEQFSAFETYPDVANARRPDPEPAYPADFDAFDPPIASAAPKSDTPTIAEWTRTASAGDSLILTGDKLSAFDGRDEGKDSSFLVFGQAGDARDLQRAQLHRLRGARAAIRLDDALPRATMYLIWPRNRSGYGRPFAVNQAEAWWIGPDRAAPGQSVSLYGRNLSHAGGTSRAHVYLKPTGRAPGWFLPVTTVNPYKVDFSLPGDLAAGSYEVWAHNGHGRRYGWSRPVKLTIDAGIEWTGKIFEASEFGARADDNASDTAALQAALDAAGREAAASGRRTTLQIPAGTFELTEILQLPGNVRIIGAGKDVTRLQARGTYARAAHTIWMGDALQPNEIANLTLDSGTAQSGNRENAFVLAGTATDVRVDNVKLIALHEPMHVMYLTSTRTTFTNCDFVGKQVLVSHGRQVRFDRCNFYGARHGVLLYAAAGSEDFSVTRCTGQDYDARDENSIDWGQGRFINIVNGSRLSRNIYIADNISRDLGVSPSYANQNTGEQISWDEAQGKFIATARLASNELATDSGSISFSSGPPVLDERHNLLAVVIDGKGLGQVRDVTEVTGKTVRVTPAWNVLPDATSRIALGSFHTRAVIYRNQLDGKARHVVQSGETAAVGIEPYGGMSQFIADGNLITDCRRGMYAMGQAIDTPAAPKGMQPSLFHLYTNNGVQNSLYGIQIDATGTVASEIGSFGYMFRGNTLDKTGRDAAHAVMNTQGHDLDMLMFDRTVSTNAPGGFNISYTVPPPAPPTGALMLLDNYFDRGDAPLTGSFVLGGPRNLLGHWLRANKRTNFASAARGVAPPPTPELPVRYFSVAARASGKPVSFPLTVFNVGASTMDYTVTQAASWLGVSGAGSIAADDAATSDSADGTLTVTCDPRGLAPRTYHGTIYVAAAGITRAAYVAFRVLP